MPPMWGLAEPALVAREPQVAIDWCEEALEVARATGEQALLVPFVVTGVRACQALVRPDAAEAWLERVRAQLEGWTRASVALEHGEGLLRLQAGSTVSARGHLEAAIAGWDAIGRIWEGTGRASTSRPA